MPTSAIGVSVICTEQGGQVCSQCVGLNPDLECGWCELDNVCSKQSQCKVSPLRVGRWLKHHLFMLWTNLV